MIVLVFLLWMSSAILFLTNGKNESTRWCSLIAFFGGCGGVGVMLGEGIERHEFILIADSLFTSLGHYMTPYAIFIFAMTFLDAYKRRMELQKAILKLIFLIPVSYMYYIDPFYPQFITNFVILAYWTVPYVLAADFFLIYSTLKETRSSVKKNKVYICIVMIPMQTFALLTNIILEAIGIKEIWYYNILIIIVQFTIFAYLIIKYGFLDVQVRFEKQKRDTTMRAIASGTAMFNHTIKNEIAKINMLLDQLKDSKLSDEAAENIELALASTRHVFELSSRIQSKLDIMNLKESEFWLVGDSIECTVASMQPYLKVKDINVLMQFENDVKVYADRIHLQEVLINIIKNAIEAMGQNGQIMFKVYKTRRSLNIEIIDNGHGIEKDKIPLVLNPFFSTKGTKGNYGLGLTYVYNVMKQHKGDILVKSKVGKGATFTLSFPKKRIVELK